MFIEILFKREQNQTKMLGKVHMFLSDLSRIRWGEIAVEGKTFGKLIFSMLTPVFMLLWVRATAFIFTSN